MANEDAVGHSKNTLSMRVKPGTYKAGQLVGFDNEGFSVLASAKNLPYGIVKQDVTAQDDKTYACIIPLANSGHTARVLISDAVKAGEWISFDKEGFSKKCSDGANVIGVALSNGQKGEHIEAITELHHNIK